MISPRLLGFSSCAAGRRGRPVAISLDNEILEKVSEERGREFDTGAAAGRAVHFSSFADQRPTDVAQRQQRERDEVGTQTRDVTSAAVNRKLLCQCVDGHADTFPRQNDGRHRSEYVQVFDDSLQCIPETIVRVRPVLTVL